MKNIQNDKAPKVPITPETKIGTLLEVYPELETVLLELSPAFAKLRHPLLRKTVAKVTSLKQAAEIGKLPMPDLIRQLRKQVGQPDWQDDFEVIRPTEPAIPAWVESGRIVERIDARPMLEKGEHPVGRVMAAVAGLQNNQLLELLSAFDPIPLKDLAESKGFKSWTRQEGEALYKTYFAK